MRSFLINVPSTWRKEVKSGILWGLLIVAILVVRDCSQPDVPADVAIQTRVDTVLVSPETIRHREPDAKVGKLEAAVMPRVAPVYIAIAPQGADSVVASFCALQTQPIPFDSASPRQAIPSVLLVQATRTDSRLFPWTKASVTQYGVASNGELSERAYQLRQGWKMRADGDSLVVQQPRIPVKPLIGTAIIATTFFLIGHYAR